MLLHRKTAVGTLVGEYTYSTDRPGIMVTLAGEDKLPSQAICDVRYIAEKRCFLVSVYADGDEARPIFTTAVKRNDQLVKVKYIGDKTVVDREGNRYSMQEDGFVKAESGDLYRVCGKNGNGIPISIVSAKKQSPMDKIASGTPRWTPEEKEAAKAVKLLYPDAVRLECGFDSVHIRADSFGWSYGNISRAAFPSMLVAETVELEEIINE